MKKFISIILSLLITLQIGCGYFKTKTQENKLKLALIPTVDVSAGGIIVCRANTPCADAVLKVINGITRFDLDGSGYVIAKAKETILGIPTEGYVAMYPIHAGFCSSPLSAFASLQICSSSVPADGDTVSSPITGITTKWVTCFVSIYNDQDDRNPSLVYHMGHSCHEACLAAESEACTGREDNTGKVIRSTCADQSPYDHVCSEKNS